MKKANKMTDKELLDTWEKGKKWMIKNEKSPKYDQSLYWDGLKRIEEIEDELRERKLGEWEEKK